LVVAGTRNIATKARSIFRECCFFIIVGITFLQIWLLCEVFAFVESSANFAVAPSTISQPLIIVDYKAVFKKKNTVFRNIVSGSKKKKCGFDAGS
jgi:hypothetical protein